MACVYGLLIAFVYLLLNAFGVCAIDCGAGLNEIGWLDVALAAEAHIGWQAARTPLIGFDGKS